MDTISSLHRTTFRRRHLPRKMWLNYIDPKRRRFTFSQQALDLCLSACSERQQHSEHQQNNDWHTLETDPHPCDIARKSSVLVIMAVQKTDSEFILRSPISPDFEAGPHRSRGGSRCDMTAVAA